MYTIGIDLGGTNIAAAIVSEEGKILIKESIPTHRERSDEEIIKAMAELSVSLIEKAGMDKSQIHSIGIGSPGMVDSEKGTLIYANNLNFRNSSVAKVFQRYFNVPVYLENDANAAAFGEYESGAGKKYRDMVAVTLGTGVGGGIIIDGKIISGSFGGGGEIGHAVILADGDECSCGRKGCWESYSSATGLIKHAKQIAINHPESLLNKLVKGDLDKMNAKIPFDAAQKGDTWATMLIDDYIKYLAIGLTNVIHYLQPQVIVLGGGVSKQGDNLIIPLQQKIEKEIYGGKEFFKTEIKIAELGNEAGIIGAAMLYKLHK